MRGHLKIATDAWTKQKPLKYVYVCGGNKRLVFNEIKWHNFWQKITKLLLLAKKNNQLNVWMHLYPVFSLIVQFVYYMTVFQQIVIMY